MIEIHVTVTEPQIENEGRRDQFTTYLVATQKTAVRRRYSDFQWLYGRLQTELPGAIVPIIPHEMAISKGKKFDPQFLEKRRRHLQYFMNVVVEHPELQRAPSMTPFMVDKLGAEFDTGRKKVETDNPTLIVPTADGEAAPSTATKVSNMFAKIRVRATKKELRSTPEEQQVESIQSHIQMVETQVRTLVRSAEALTQATGQMATVLTDMRIPIAEWKSGYQQSSKVSDDICDMMAALLEFTNDYSQLMDHKYREEQIEFEDVMIRLGNDVKAFKIALQQRRQWQVAYTARSEQISSKEEQIAKATYNLKPPEVTGKLSYERSELQKLAYAEKDKLEETTARFLQEAARSKTRLEDQLKEAFRQYAKIQIAYTNRISNAWGQLLPYVGEPQEEAEEEIEDGDDEQGYAEEDQGDTKENNGQDEEEAEENGHVDDDTGGQEQGEDEQEGEAEEGVGDEGATPVEENGSDDPKPPAPPSNPPPPPPPADDVIEEE